MSIICPSILWEKLDSSSFKHSSSEDPAVKFETEGGWSITRPRFTRRPPRVFSLQFTDLSNTEKMVIEQLYTDARGASEIITGWQHPTTAEVLNIRFKQGKAPVFQYKGHGTNFRWNVTGIEIEEV